MRMPVEFVIPGEPGVWKRAGTTKGGRRYTERGPAAYKAKVIVLARAAGVRVLNGPVGLDIRAYWPCKGAPRKREPRPECWKATRPDIDNAPVKLIMDSLGGVAYVDDAQVVSVVAQKMHAAQGSPPRVVVRVIQLEE